MRNWFVFMLLLALASGASADPRQVTIIPVYYQPAAELIEVLRPLLDPGSSLSAHGDRLIIRASAAEIANISQAIEALDRAPRSLVVEVRQHNVGQQHGRRTLSTRSPNEAVQRVRTLDGQPARFSAGQLVPLYQGGMVDRHGRPLSTGGIEYTAFSTGIDIVPRTRGDEVTLEIQRQAEQPFGDGRYLTQEARTVLHGQLGEWIDIGSEQRSVPVDERGRHWSTVDRRDFVLQVRVQALN